MKKISLFVSALAVILTGCSKDDSLMNQEGNTALGISSASMSATVSTKATPVPLTTGSIGVYRTANAGSGYTAQLSEYTYNTSWGSSNLIYLNNNSAQICAFYPYAYVVPAVFDPTAVALTAQKQDNAKELVYATNAAYSNTNKTAIFNMVQAYSKITFTINKDATYTGNCAISSISLSNAALVQSNTINITNGTYGTGTVAAVTYNPAIASIATSATSALLLPPTKVGTDMTGNITLSIIVDGSTLTVAIPVSSFNGKLVLGNNYQVTLTIKGTAIVVSSVTILGWNDTTVAGVLYPEI